jgi:hypothetical protein
MWKWDGTYLGLHLGWFKTCALVTAGILLEENQSLFQSFSEHSLNPKYCTLK